MPANQLSHTPNTFRAEQSGRPPPPDRRPFLVTYMTLLWSDCNSTGCHRYLPEVRLVSKAAWAPQPFPGSSASAGASVYRELQS